MRRWFARILFWVTAVPLVLAAATFAIANRAPVEISLDPAPYILEAPLYAIALGGLALGFVIGLVLTWPALARWRGVARARARSIATLEDEVARLNRERTNKPPSGSAVASVPGTIAPT